jgi:hypothetical protein
MAIGLKALEGLKMTRRPNLVVSLEKWTGDPKSRLIFKEPRASELFPDASNLKEIQIMFPEFPAPMTYQVNLMARCYVPDDGEEEAEPVSAIGGIARNHKEVFFHILTEFFTAFDVSDPDEKVEESKNASTE